MASSTRTGYLTWGFIEAIGGRECARRRTRRVRRQRDRLAGDVRRRILRFVEILVFGGTRQVSHSIAAEAVSRGHSVTCAARGESGPVPEGARLVPVDRDVPGSLEVLGGEFDAVVDVARMSARWVREALNALADRTGHWTFVSTGSVYARLDLTDQDVSAPLLEPHAPGDPEDDGDPETYGRIKVASENATRETIGDRAFIVRAGLLSGGLDRSDRFGYWPARLARGGRVVVPDVPDQRVQHLDTRDLARWIIDAAEQRLTGTYDAVGPSVPFGELLTEIASMIAPAGVDWLPVAPETLLDAGVQPFMGPKSLPLWLPETHLALGTHDGSRSYDAGLRTRPLAETVTDALARERSLGLDRARNAGLSSAEEDELIDLVRHES